MTSTYHRVYLPAAILPGLRDEISTRLRIFMTLGGVGIARKSILHRFLSFALPLCFSPVRARALEIVGKTDKVHSLSRSNEAAGAYACSILLVLPPCHIPNLGRG